MRSAATTAAYHGAHGAPLCTTGTVRQRPYAARPRLTQLPAVRAPCMLPLVSFPSALQSPEAPRPRVLMSSSLQDSSSAGSGAHEQHRLLGGSLSPISPAGTSSGFASPHLDNGSGGMVAGGWKEAMAAAQEDRRHGAASWGGQLRRWWSVFYRSTDWNVVCAWGIALFFFLLWMMSPAGRFESRNAACPVPLDFDLDAWARQQARIRQQIQMEQGELERIRRDRDALAASTPVAAAAPSSACPQCSSTESLSAAEIEFRRAWSSGLSEPLVFDASTAAFQLSSHVGSQVRKRVHLKDRVVPHLLQFAESTFEPGDEAGQLARLRCHANMMD